MSESARRNIRELLTREEVARLTERSNWKGTREVLFTWSVIVATMVVVARWPSVLTIGIALVVLGSRQMALAVLMHDASHGILMRSKWWNDFAGDWLCAAPNNLFMRPYWEHHRRHHVHAGTERDPDTSLVAGFPTTKRSMVRKVARDLSGVSSAKRLFAIVMMGIGRMKYTAALDVTWIDTSKRSRGEALGMAFRNLGPLALFNVVTFVLLWAIGSPWLFALWWGAYFTTYSLFLRVRSFSEHGATKVSPDVFESTRTTLPSWLGRFFWAPHHVHYHLEHHLLMTVPCYHLAELHEVLEAKGVLRDALVARGGYPEVVRAVIRPA